MKPLEGALVRILSDQNARADEKATVGSGTVVSRRFICTCVHVVAHTIGCNPDTETLPDDGT
jgi:hypothetical protein